VISPSSGRGVVLALTDSQLAQVMYTAKAIPRDRRDEYLQRVADQLRGRDLATAMFSVPARRLGRPSCGT